MSIQDDSNSNNNNNPQDDNGPMITPPSQPPKKRGKTTKKEKDTLLSENIKEKWAHIDLQDEPEQQQGPQQEPLKKMVRIWRLDASKEFILLLGIFIVITGLIAYNPYQSMKMSEQLVEIAHQNKEMNTANLNNTSRIIDILSTSTYNVTASRSDIVKVLILYGQENDRDIEKLLKANNITDPDYTTINSTHVSTENGTIKLAFPIDLLNFSNHNGIINNSSNSNSNSNSN